MSLPPRSPSAHDRASRARMGVSASGLMLTLLLANQSAARDAPEPLPYLLQSSPQALRFATARVPTAPPPKPGERDAMDAHAGADSPSPFAAGPGDQSRKDDPTATGEAVSAGEVNDTAAQPAPPLPSPPPACRSCPMAMHRRRRSPWKICYPIFPLLRNPPAGRAMK
jgi:hypothetical protein